MAEISSPTIGKSEKKKGFEKYEIEEAARTLQHAMEIKNSPALMAEAMKHLKKQKDNAHQAITWADNIKKK